MSSFENLLKELHNNGMISDSDKVVVINPSTEEETTQTAAIEITNKRQFIIPEDYNLVLAYEGDINSQIVTFSLPKFHENHELALCKNKKLLWNNVSAKTEGVSDLILLENSSSEDTTIKVSWIVPPEAFVRAGQLEISISFYDFGTNGIAFAWNTPVFKGFSVGESNQYVGIGLNSPEALPPAKRPAKNEILFVDVENRNIVAPAEYNYVVGNYGDKGISTVHFQMQRYVHGMDLLGTNTEITIYGYLGELDFSNNISGVNRYSAEGSYGEGLVDFDWNVPDELLENTENYVGNLSVSILISQSNDGAITKRWNSSPFLGLIIGESDYGFNNGELPIAIKQYKIIGNKAKDYNSYNEVAGIVQIRDNLETPDIAPEKNELVAEYINGKFIGLKIGTDEGAVNAGLTQETLYPMIKAYLQSNQFTFNANLVSDINFHFEALKQDYPQWLSVSKFIDENDPETKTFSWFVDLTEDVDDKQEVFLVLETTKSLVPGKYRITYDCDIQWLALGSTTLNGSISPYDTPFEFVVEASEKMRMESGPLTANELNGLTIKLKLERIG